MASTCQFCGAAARPLYEVSLGIAQSRMWRCAGCSSCQIDPELPAEAIAKFYAESYFHSEPWEIAKGNALAPDYARKVLRGWRPKSGVPVLEIGPGYGFFARSVRARFDVPVEVVELSAVCRDYIAQHEPRLELAGQTIEDLPAGARYQAIFCFHVVEHLQRLGPFLSAAAARLRPGARLWILTPNAVSRTFQLMGERWGWTCPNEHFEFLSPRIPDDYYARFGLTRLRSRDLQPAPVHYPSRWYPRVCGWRDGLMRRIDGTTRAQTIHWRLLRRAVLPLVPRLEQNRNQVSLLPLERLWARFFRSGPHDELLLVLEKTRALTKPVVATC